MWSSFAVKTLRQTTEDRFDHRVSLWAIIMMIAIKSMIIHFDDVSSLLRTVCLLDLGNSPEC